jgi:hypothetical protein
MLLQKNEYTKLDAPYLKKESDISNGDIVKILSDALEQPDNFNPGQIQTLIKISTKNGERYATLNQTSINILITEFKTNDAKDWIGKEAKVLTKKGVFAGKKGIALYLAGKDWELDEYGSPVKAGSESVQEEPYQEDTINEEGIRIEDVPF